MAVGGIADGLLDLLPVGADAGFLAVHDHLRREDLPVAAGMGIGLLALGEGLMGERVLPAEIIPVIDRKGERHDIRLAGEIGQQRIGRRAGGAALAGEQFEHRARRFRERRLEEGSKTESRQRPFQSGRHDARHETPSPAQWELTLA